jgi:hypothetical protein
MEKQITPSQPENVMTMKNPMEKIDEPRNSVSVSQTEQSNERAYQPPQLQIYGDIHELTLAGNKKYKFDGSGYSSST